ncbi:hypothetical protein BC830DRAFT_1090446 [Chytriomyces sp. MP71]|nr:hypothetical protein BC830DRAFT_1090446 [Chytriomyces sp. MP71]
MAKVQAEDISNQAPSLTFVWLNFGLWLAGVTYTINQRLFGGFRTKAFNRGDSDFIYKGQACVFLVAVGFAYLGYIGTKNVQKKAIIQIFMMTNAVVATSWFLLYLRAGVTLVDVAGNPLDTIRHLEWLHDQSNLVYIMCLLTNTDTVTTVRAMVMSTLTFVFGVLGGLARHPFDELFITLSWMVHLHLCKDIVDVFQKAIDGEVPCKVNTWTLRRSGDVVLFSFNYISVAGWLVKKCVRFLFCLLHTGEAHIAFGEFVAKIVLMLVIDTVAKMGSFTTSLDEQMATSDKFVGKYDSRRDPGPVESGKVACAEEFASVTIFFSDICTFTPLSQRTSTKDMLASLHKMRIYGMYKSFRLVTGEPIEIRAGLNSGPVTAGILGETNPHWCIVGDAVVIASKMEATSKHMKVHISENTYKLLKGSSKFITSPGEPVTLKDQVIQTYFLEGRA